MHERKEGSRQGPADKAALSLSYDYVSGLKLKPTAKKKK